MCEGVPIFANNKRALYGRKTNSHSTAAESLRIKEDNYRKFEYRFWDKTIPILPMFDLWEMGLYPTTLKNGKFLIYVPLVNGKKPIIK